MNYRLTVFKVEGDSKTPLSVHYYTNKLDMILDVEYWVDVAKDNIFFESCKMVTDSLNSKL